jgi:hypothetical protein
MTMQACGSRRRCVCWSSGRHRGPQAGRPRHPGAGALCGAADGPAAVTEKERLRWLVYVLLLLRIWIQGAFLPRRSLMRDCLTGRRWQLDRTYWGDRNPTCRVSAPPDPWQRRAWHAMHDACTSGLAEIRTYTCVRIEPSCLFAGSLVLPYHANKCSRSGPLVDASRILPPAGVSLTPDGIGHR